MKKTKKPKLSWEILKQKERELQTLFQKVENLKEVFQKKAPNNWYIDKDILNWFDHKKANTEEYIEFSPSIELLKKETTERELLNHDRAVRLPIRQALDMFVEFVKNDQVPADNRGIIIFLSTKNMSETNCEVHLWCDTRSELSACTTGVYLDDTWSDEYILRKEK
ncbi:MAG: hypothetical protein PHC89_00410 [Candidatus Pacebacteria bacterium]|nr:hypothetical protein [Candidatus Paceibacterota bacterium]